MTAQAHYDRIRELTDEQKRCVKVAQFILDRHAQDDDALWVAENFMLRAREINDELFEVMLF